MKLKNKIFIVLFFLLVFLLLSSKCFATIDYQGYEFPEFPKDYNNYKYSYIWYYPNYNRYSLCLSNSKMFFSSDNTLSNGISVDFDSDVYDFFYTEDLHFIVYNFIPSVDNSSWTFSMELDDDLFKLVTGNYTFIYSSENIIDEDNNSVFFYKTPFLHFTNTQSTIAAILCQNLARTLHQIIPVGVVIIAAMVTVSLIAYFKFWRT